mmetsp:Transcript_36905/g.93572  ORF Transcript_36905/g.93572 Transcript_36905/m.93572 type:complete len:238 (+) Transcript_36905:1140-1853(+)
MRLRAPLQRAQQRRVPVDHRLALLHLLQLGAARVHGGLQLRPAPRVLLQRRLRVLHRLLPLADLRRVHHVVEVPLRRPGDLGLRGHRFLAVLAPADLVFALGRDHPELCHALAREVLLQLLDAVARLRGAEQYKVHAAVVAQHAEHVAAVLGLHRERLVEPRGDAELLELLRARPLAWLVGLALVTVDVDGLIAAHHLIERVARAIRARDEGGEDLDVDHLLDQLALLRVEHVDLHE